MSNSAVESAALESNARTEIETETPSHKRLRVTASPPADPEPESHPDDSKAQTASANLDPAADPVTKQPSQQLLEQSADSQPDVETEESPLLTPATPSEALLLTPPSYSSCFEQATEDRVSSDADEDDAAQGQGATNSGHTTFISHHIQEHRSSFRADSPHRIICVEVEVPVEEVAAAAAARRRRN